MMLMELLIVCIIGSVVTGGIIMLWFNINQSSAITTSHAEARDFARDGVARLSREIRDAEALPSNVAVQQAGPFSITFTTTFNKLGNDVDTTKPRLVRYWYDKTARCLYRDAYASNVTDLSTSPPYESRRIIIPHMLNDDEMPLFSYTYLDSDALRHPTLDEDPIYEITGPDDLSRILLVRIHALVDLDPGKAPNGMDISTDAQLRNQRIIN